MTQPAAEAGTQVDAHELARRIHCRGRERPPAEASALMDRLEASAARLEDPASKTAAWLQHALSDPPASSEEELHAAGVEPETVADVATLGRRKDEDDRAYAERVIASGRRTAMAVAAAGLRAAAERSDEAGDAIAGVKLRTLARWIEAGRRYLEPDAGPGTEEELQALERGLHALHDRLAAMAQKSYPITLRMNQDQTARTLETLRRTAMLAGLLTLDITAADPRTERDDVRAVYNDAPDFASSTVIILRMCIRRLERLLGNDEQAGQTPQPR